MGSEGRQQNGFLKKMNSFKKCAYVSAVHEAFLNKYNIHTYAASTLHGHNCGQKQVTILPHFFKQIKLLTTSIFLTVFLHQYGNIIISTVYMCVLMVF